MMMIHVSTAVNSECVIDVSFKKSFCALIRLWWHCCWPNGINAFDIKKQLQQLFITGLE